MDTTVTLDEPHFRSLTARASELGLTPAQFLQSLIDADSRSFDEILAPARKGFESVSDDDLEVVMERARKAARTPQD